MKKTFNTNIAREMEGLLMKNSLMILLNTFDSNTKKCNPIFLTEKEDSDYAIKIFSDLTAYEGYFYVKKNNKRYKYVIKDSFDLPWIENLSNRAIRLKIRDIFNSIMSTPNKNTTIRVRLDKMFNYIKNNYFDIFEYYKSQNDMNENNLKHKTTIYNINKDSATFKSLLTAKEKEILNNRLVDMNIDPNYKRVDLEQRKKNSIYLSFHKGVVIFEDYEGNPYKDEQGNIMIDINCYRKAKDELETEQLFMKHCLNRYYNYLVSRNAILYVTDKKLYPKYKGLVFINK